jgi:cell division protein FtsB
MPDIDTDAIRSAPQVAEPGNNTFAVWFDRNNDPYLTFYREDAYADGKARWLNADLYDTGDEDDGPKTWAELCELAEGMKGPQLLVPAAEVERLRAENTDLRQQLDRANTGRQQLQTDLDEQAATIGQQMNEIDDLRVQVAGRDKNIESLHKENDRLRLHVEALENTADEYLKEKQYLGEWLAKGEAERDVAREAVARLREGLASLDRNCTATAKEFDAVQSAAADSHARLLRSIASAARAHLAGEPR